VTQVVEDIVRRAAAFEAAAHAVFSSFDSSPSRVVELIDARKQLAILNLKQNELMRDALRAIELDLLRPAIVMSWAAFIDFIEEKLASDGLIAVHAKRPAWAKYASMDDLKESISEYQLVEVAKDTKVITKAEMKALHGLLSKRNECAHPTGYTPKLSEAIGFAAEILNRMPTIDQRSPKA
jgi:hypothetical protein